MYIRGDAIVDLLTIQETAKLLKVTPTTVRRYITAGRLPAVRVGRGVRVRKEALADLLVPVTATRPDLRLSEPQRQATHMIEADRTDLRPMTEEQAQQALQAVEQARQTQVQQLARRGGEPFAPSWELVAEGREQRTRELA